MTDETVYRTMLFDFYGELLTDKQREYFDLHYNEDYSLGEIAEMTGISRQGVGHYQAGRGYPPENGGENRLGPPVPGDPGQSGGDRGIPPAAGFHDAGRGESPGGTADRQGA